MAIGGQQQPQILTQNFMCIAHVNNKSIYDFGELNKFDKGLAPLLEPKNVMLFMGEAGQEGGWCVGNLSIYR